MRMSIIDQMEQAVQLDQGLLRTFRQDIKYDTELLSGQFNTRNSVLDRGLQAIVRWLWLPSDSGTVLEPLDVGAFTGFTLADAQIRQHLMTTKVGYSRHFVLTIEYRDKDNVPYGNMKEITSKELLAVWMHDIDNTAKHQLNYLKELERLGQTTEKT